VGQLVVAMTADFGSTSFRGWLESWLMPSAIRASLAPEGRMGRTTREAFDLRAAAQWTRILYHDAMFKELSQRVTAAIGFVCIRSGRSLSTGPG